MAVAGFLAGRPRARHAESGPKVLGMAERLGVLTGRVLAIAPSLPGLAGAAAVSAGSGFAVSHVFGHGLAPWVGLTVGGVFALLLDRRL